MISPTPEQLRKAVVDGDIDLCRQLAAAAVEGGLDLLSVVEHGFAAGIREVGDLWEQGEYFLPELVQGAEAMKAAMAVINPALARLRGEGPGVRKVVVGTVQGDMHDIGKSLVGTLLEANGYEVHDLGCDVSVERFVETARRVEADLIGASALLTTTMAVQARLVDAARRIGVPVIVGGAPANPRWAEQIGAAYANNAQDAVRVVGELLSP